MRFMLFTDKKVNECLAAINERVQTPGSASRPELQGKTDKKGSFSLAIYGAVLGRFVRQTRLDAQIERDGNMTVIRGSVASGASPEQQRLILAAILLCSTYILLQGEVLLALLMVVAGAVIYIPLRGDYENSERLLIEVEKTLKASPKPPKTTAAAPAKASTSVQRKPAAKSAVKNARSAPAKKPASKAPVKAAAKTASRTAK